MDHLKLSNNRRKFLIAHRSCSACLVAHAAMKIGKKSYWDPKKEILNGNVEANKLFSRSQRLPYGTNYVLGRNNKRRPIKN